MITVLPGHADTLLMPTECVCSDRTLWEWHPVWWFVVLFFPQDLAARNVLVGEGELCKVADFGLMRELPRDDSIYKSTSNLPCPIRWMAPECITDRHYSLASDVWAFGVLQWEMFNPMKEMPYPGIDNLQVSPKPAASATTYYEYVHEYMIPMMWMTFCSFAEEERIEKMQYGCSRP